MAGTSVVRVILINIIVIIVLFALIIGGYFYYTGATNYVTTSDAQVTGQIIPITVPYAGKLNHWYAAVNSTVNQGDLLGSESSKSVLAMNPGLGALVSHNQSAAQKLTNFESVTSPISGTIIQNTASPGEFVQPGQVLAQVVDLGNLNVTANVPETEIRHVSVGQTVDVYIDGIPNTDFKGVVKSIGNTTNSVFSIIPNATAAQGSYTNVVQRIPVVISLNGGYAGKALVPGMSASVVIHINSSNA